MDISKFESIMNDDDIGGIKLSETGCNAVNGLMIIQKYIPTRGVTGADHDVIFSVTSEEILSAGITEDDANELRMYNWMLDDDRLACFV